MAYQGGLVVSVIVSGKPVREYNADGTRTCKIPFNSEYSLRLKNKSKGRALASITIDGMEVLTGNKKLVLGRGQTVDVERFIDDLNSGNKFKFISLEEGAASGEIQDPTSEENGIIEVKFYKEKFPPKKRYLHTHNKGGFNPLLRGKGKKLGGRIGGSASWSNDTTSADLYKEVSNTSHIDTNCFHPGTVFGSEETEILEPQSLDLESEKGATVEGSHSSQQFQMTTEHFETEWVPEIVTLQLRAPAQVCSGFGVFLKNKKRPTAVFYEKTDALAYTSDLDDDLQVTLKPISDISQYL